MTSRMLASLLLAGLFASAHADYGRLFFTPAQRTTLDNARKKNVQVEVGDTKPDEAPVSRNVSINGVVRSSDGKSTVWLNNKSVSGRKADGLDISTQRGDGRIQVSIPDSGRSVALKVGQSAEIMSGTIDDGYLRRATPSQASAPSTSEKPTTPGQELLTAPSTPTRAPIPAGADTNRRTDSK